MIRRVGIALLVAVGLATLPAAPAAAGPAEDIHALVNQARWENGQAGLLRNSAIDQVAANWAAQLAASGTLAHNPNYSSEIPGGWTAAAENVAQGHPTGGAMFDGWMASSGHRANILGDYTDIGIAFVTGGGTTWGVQVFARYPGHAGPAAPAPPPPPAPAPPPEAPAATEPTSPVPSASPTPPGTRSATPEPRGTEETILLTRDDPGASRQPWWPIPVGILLLAAATLVGIRRRRRSAA